MNFFFFNDPATTKIYTLSLHTLFRSQTPATKASSENAQAVFPRFDSRENRFRFDHNSPLNALSRRSEEHTSELQSLRHLVCRLLLEKKKIKKDNIRIF